MDDNDPHINPKFDAARVLREDQLGALGFGLVAAFAMTVGRGFNINITDQSDRAGWVYAFVVDGEVVRIGWTERRLAKRLGPWRADVRRGFRLTPEERARRTEDVGISARVRRKWLTWLEVIDCFHAIVRKYGHGTIYAKIGSCDSTLPGVTPHESPHFRGTRKGLNLRVSALPDGESAGWGTYARAEGAI